MVIRVCGAIIQYNQILMVQHVKDGRHFWTLPGGSVESDENLEKAAAREVMEETSLQTVAKIQLFDEGFCAP